MKYIATGFLIVLDPEPCVHGPDHKECVDFIYPISPQLREAQPSYLISLKDTVHQSSKFRHLFELYRAKLEKDDLYGPDLQRIKKEMMELEDLIGEKANEDPLKHKLDEKLEPAVKANTDWHITMVKFSGKFCNDAALDDKLHSVVSYYRAMAPRVTSAVGECSEAVLSSLAEKFCGFAEPLSEWNRGHHKDQNKDWSDGFDGDCFDDLLDWAEKTLLHAKVDEFMPIHKKAKAVPQYT